MCNKDLYCCPVRGLKSPQRLLCVKSCVRRCPGWGKGAGELKTHRSIPSQTKTTDILLTLERPQADVDSAVGSYPWTWSVVSVFLWIFEALAQNE